MKAAKAAAVKNEKWSDGDTLTLVAFVGDHYDEYRSFSAGVICNFCSQNVACKSMSD